MYDLAAQVQQLIQLVLDLRRRVNKLADQVARAEQNLQFVPAGGGGGGSGGGNIYYIAPVVIAATGNVTGQTVYQLVSGTPMAIMTTATVYNIMASATSATLTSPIIVAPNGDGTYLAVSQGCT